jgi:hypothetical protein
MLCAVRPRLEKTLKKEATYASNYRTRLANFAGVCAT